MRQLYSSLSLENFSQCHSANGQSDRKLSQGRGGGCQWRRLQGKLGAHFSSCAVCLGHWLQRPQQDYHRDCGECHGLVGRDRLCKRVYLRRLQAPAQKVQFHRGVSKGTNRHKKQQSNQSSSERAPDYASRPAFTRGRRPRNLTGPYLATGGSYRKIHRPKSA